MWREDLHSIRAVVAKGDFEYSLETPWKPYCDPRGRASWDRARTLPGAVAPAGGPSDRDLREAPRLYTAGFRRHKGDFLPTNDRPCVLQGGHVSSDGKGTDRSL